MPAITHLQQGVHLSDLSLGSVFDVETKSRHYRIEYLGKSEVRISGHPHICPLPTRAHLLGSTSDSGEFEAGFIGRGMRLELRLFGERTPFTTSKILDIRLES